jgi:hypothetical protein
MHREEEGKGGICFDWHAQLPLILNDITNKAGDAQKEGPLDMPILAGPVPAANKNVM